VIVELRRRAEGDLREAGKLTIGALAASFGNVCWYGGSSAEYLGSEAGIASRRGISIAR
jgi:hypothetical protein